MKEDRERGSGGGIGGDPDGSEGLVGDRGVGGETNGGLAEIIRQIGRRTSEEGANGISV